MDAPDGVTSGAELKAEIDATRGRVAKPNLHRIEVERNADGEVESVRFICDGGDAARCHHYPDCDCETWTRELHGQTFGQTIGYAPSGHPLHASETLPPAPGHEDVQQPECWIDPWFNATTDYWSDFADLYDGPLDTHDPEVYGEHADWLISGPVETTFEGDYMTWEYALDQVSSPADPKAGA